MSNNRAGKKARTRTPGASAFDVESRNARCILQHDHAIERAKHGKSLSAGGDDREL